MRFDYLHLAYMHPIRAEGVRARISVPSPLDVITWGLFAGPPFPSLLQKKTPVHSYPFRNAQTMYGVALRNFSHPPLDTPHYGEGGVYRSLADHGPFLSRLLFLIPDYSKQQNAMPIPASRATRTPSSNLFLICWVQTAAVMVGECDCGAFSASAGGACCRHQSVWCNIVVCNIVLIKKEPNKGDWLAV